MKVHHKHFHLARRKMGHIIDEVYTTLLHYGSGEVDLRIVREADGMRMFAKSDFDPDYLEEIERMGELLQPAVRSPAIVEMFWELAGEDPYTGESKLSLIGQMADDVAFTIGDQNVSIEIYIAY